MNELNLTIPLEPPSGNHYKTFRVVSGPKGAFVSWYLTSKAKMWNSAVEGIVAIRDFSEVAGVRLCDKHAITYTVYQGRGSRGDVDNYAKCILDALVKAGVLKSDASVVDLHAHKRRDRLNPRTEIHIREVA
jgi:Holliday junction resolvase RusA-like endonuclease